MITKQIATSHFPHEPLSEVADFLDHLRKPVKQSDRVPGDFPYYGANGQQGTIDGYLFDEPLILLAEDGGHFDQPERGIAYTIRGKTWVNNHAHIIKPKDNTDFRFLFHVLRNYDVNPFISGSTRKKLTKGQAAQIAIPLPPLAEQKRIARILDQADALRRQRQRALDQLNQLGQSIFYEMFQNHERKPLADFCEFITDGTHQTPTYTDQGVIFLSARNVTKEKINWDKVKYISKELHEKISKRAYPRKGDILLAKNGTTGVAAEVKSDVEFSIYVSLALLRPHKDTNPTFLLYAVNSEKARRQYTRSLKGVGVSNLHLKDIRIAHVPSPSGIEQEVFASKVRGIENSVTNLDRGLTEANNLFASLQQRAFRGEL